MGDFEIGPIIEELESVYKSNSNLEDYWELEKAQLSAILPQVASDISFNYRIERALAAGGGGIVFVVHDNNLDKKRALKISRPSPGKEQLLATILSSETDNLSRLSHPNLIQIYAKGAAELEEKTFPYYVMDFVEGAKDADEYLKEVNPQTIDVLSIFHGILSAVEYIHAQGTIHMDIKPSNIIITPEGMPILSDLGFAKQIKKDGYTLIGGTEGFIHPEARKLVNEVVTDPNRLRGSISRKQLNPVWDLYSLGKTFLLMLNILDEKVRALSPYAMRYLKLLSCRLLDGYNTEDERAVGLSASTFKEIKYERCKQALIDLEKLTGSYNIESRIPELNLHHQDTIQVTTLSVTPFTDRVRDVINHPALLRLGNITQLGMLNLVYPSANHTRLEHSIGTYALLIRFVMALIKDPLNPLFCQIMDEEDIRAILLVALMHDLGQYPLAHDIEEAYLTFSHEKFGIKLLKEKYASLRSLIENESGWNVPFARVKNILEANPQTSKGNLKDRILNSLVNGPIDADKIDYLVRDNFHLGLNYARAIDLERLLRCLTIVFHDKGDWTYAALGIHEKGKVPAESVAFVRYAMFGQVYWHHAYRAIKAMLHRLVWEALDEHKDENEIKKFRERFEEFIFSLEISLSQKQKSLFANNFSRLPTEEGDVCQINQLDYEVVKWLAINSNDFGRKLFKLIRDRRLFKRIIVLTMEKTEDKQLMDNTTSFFQVNHKNWKKKLAFQKAFQQKILDIVERGKEPEPVSKAITSDIRNSFIVDCREQVVLLIDFPPKRPGTTTALNYVVEEDRRRYKDDEIKMGSLETSVVWQTLQDNFHKSIGKLRIFCHPDYIEFLAAFLQRSEMENALAEALNSVDNE